MELNDALKQVRNKKRGFSQAIDVIINLKDIDLKKPEHQIDFFLQLPIDPKKKIKVAALVDQELAEEAKKVCDAVVLQEDFAAFTKNKKQVKKFANEHGFILGQANIMPKIASSFGRVLGPRGKMPNPKAGAIVPPKGALQPVYNRLQKTIRVQAKGVAVLQCRIGSEAMNDEELQKNFSAIYDQLLHTLPNGEANIRSLYLKTTMGKPVKVR